jgi:hypothetical protein
MAKQIVYKLMEKCKKMKYYNAKTFEILKASLNMCILIQQLPFWTVTFRANSLGKLSLKEMTLKYYFVSVLRDSFPIIIMRQNYYNIINTCLKYQQ